VVAAAVCALVAAVPILAAGVLLASSYLDLSE
jgi:hypothetical protein